MALEPVDLQVDTDALRELGIEIQALINALAGTSCRAADPAMGDDVAAAVDRFTGAWTGGRRQITGKLQDCLAYVELAIGGYCGTENGLYRALQPGTTTREKTS